MGKYLFKFTSEDTRPALKNVGSVAFMLIDFQLVFFL